MTPLRPMMPINDLNHDQPVETVPESTNNVPLGPTWEDDETTATFVLRALATLLCGAFLAWSQYFGGIVSTTNWSGWIQMSLVTNLLFPLGIIWLFFGQGILHQSWLKDQRSNAWNYGWNFGNWRRHARWSLVFGVVMLIIMAIFRFLPQGSEAALYYKTNYLPPISGTGTVVMLFVTTILYMFCWEFFFRGFLLFGMAQGFGPVLAILLQTAIFGAAHYGKPMPEFYSSFAGGALLGWVCWKEKSFAPAFYTHAAIHVLWLFLVLL